MEKVFKVKNNQIEIKNDVWIVLENDAIYKRFPNIKKLKIVREFKSPEKVPDIDFKLFSKLSEIEELEIVLDKGNLWSNRIPSDYEETRIYLNFLEILKLKKLKKLLINTDYVSTKDLMAIFEERAGAQEKFIFEYNLNHPASDAEQPPMIYEEEFDQDSYDKYNELESENVESNFQIANNENETSEISLVEVAVFRMREDEGNKEREEKEMKEKLKEMKEKNFGEGKLIPAKNGNKTYIWGDGTTLTGKFNATIKGKFDLNSNFPNYGIYEYTDGLIYEGELKNGLHDGLGKMTFPDGRFFYGKFKKNELVKELRDEKEEENFKKIIKILKPKKNNDGSYSYTRPVESEINLMKNDIFLFDLIRSILMDNSVLDKLIKKYKI